LILQYINDVTELNDISTELQDETLDEAMELIVKLVVKDDIPPTQIPKQIVRTSALAGQLRLKAKYYMLFAKDDPMANKKKNTFLTCAESLEKITDSLKYVAKSTM